MNTFWLWYGITIIPHDISTKPIYDNLHQLAEGLILREYKIYLEIVYITQA